MRAVSSTFVVSAAQVGQAPQTNLPEVAFVGRSNVGKSSMINALLLRKKLARVSNTPGRTRLLNFFEVDLGIAEGKREKLSICDLPGYGYAKAPRDEIKTWKVMIEGYLIGRGALRATVALIDSRHGAGEQDLTLLHWMASLGRPIIVVATKIDKLAKAQRRPALEAIGRELEMPTPIGFSSETGDGRDELWEAVHALTSLDQPETT